MATAMNEIGAACEEVADWLEAHGYQVHSVQPWINVVGLFRVRDPVVHFPSSNFLRNTLAMIGLSVL